MQKALDRVVVEKMSAMMRFLYPLFAKHPPPPNEVKLELFTNLVAMLGDFDKEFAKRGTLFLGGAAPCMADYMLWPYFERIECVPLLHSDIKDSLTLPTDLVNLNN